MQELLDHVKSTLPLLPDEQLHSLIDPSGCNLSVKDAQTLVLLDDGERLAYYQRVRSQVQDRLLGGTGPPGRVSLAEIGRNVGNW